MIALIHSAANAVPWNHDADRIENPTGTPVE